MWGALSDERIGLSFVYATGPCQRSLSQVRVPWYSGPYFTVSELRLPFSSPPTTRRVTVEVFGPASTRVPWYSPPYNCRYIASAPTTQKRAYIVVGKCCIARVAARTRQKSSHMITILPTYWRADCCLATTYRRSSYC
jgi:hypothetical protein